MPLHRELTGMLQFYDNSFGSTSDGISWLTISFCCGLFHSSAHMQTELVAFVLDIFPKKPLMKLMKLILLLRNPLYT